MQRLVKKTPFLKLAERAQKSSTRMKTIQRPSGKLISAAAHQPGKVEHPKTRGSLECPGAAAWWRKRFVIKPANALLPGDTVAGTV